MLNAAEDRGVEGRRWWRHVGVRQREEERRRPLVRRSEDEAIEVIREERKGLAGRRVERWSSSDGDRRALGFPSATLDGRVCSTCEDDVMRGMRGETEEMNGSARTFAVLQSHSSISSFHQPGWHPCKRVTAVRGKQDRTKEAT